jgi:hypothetical protein
MTRVHSVNTERITIMDPNAALAEAREIAARLLGDWEELDSLSDGARHRDAHDLAERVQALDQWLSRSGFLPQDWARLVTPSDKPVNEPVNDRPNPYDDTSEQVLLVAFSVYGKDRVQAQERLMRRLPRPGSRDFASPIESWWIAEDDRRDGSDCDSAVFVRPGRQRVARDILRRRHLA